MQRNEINTVFNAIDKVDTLSHEGRQNLEKIRIKIGEGASTAMALLYAVEYQGSNERCCPAGREFAIEQYLGAISNFEPGKIPPILWPIKTDM